MNPFDIFTRGRTYSKFLPREVPDNVLRAIYELAKFGPTSANSQPMRLVFVRSPAGKAALLPLVDAGNRDKVRSAPVTAIIAYDLNFPDFMPKVFPHAPGAAEWFKNNRFETAFRNSSLQGAYFMLAARAVGLDCGPMSGFNRVGIDNEFFPTGEARSNFLCNLGYGDETSLHPRSPRLNFEEVCSFV